MIDQAKDPMTALAQQYATKYTNRHTPGETAFAFGPEAWQEFCKAVRANATPVVPTGWKLVPTIPTEEMFAAFCEVASSTSWSDVPKNEKQGVRKGMTPAYQGMIAAAQLPQQSAQPVAQMVGLDDGLGTVYVEFLCDRPIAGTKLYPAAQPVGLQTCNCRWDGETTVQQCTLHQAWEDNQHDQADELRHFRAAAQLVTASPAGIRFTNLVLDIRRVIGWEAPLNDFEVVAELQAYLASLTAQPVEVQRQVTQDEGRLFRSAAMRSAKVVGKGKLVEVQRVGISDTERLDFLIDNCAYMVSDDNCDVGCEMCINEDGEPIFPSYGPAPHTCFHRIPGASLGESIPQNRSEWPTNFKEDPDCTGLGTYWCPSCGRGKPASEGGAA